jgi:glutathione S-transferase
MLTLYSHPFAHYCQKVLIALNELGVEYRTLEEQRDFDRAELAVLWPPATIPVLRDGDHLIGESSIIIEHVGGEQLIPSLEARLWDRLCDQYIGGSVQTIVLHALDRGSDESAAQRARDRLTVSCAMLESQLAAHEWLAGDTFTIADCAAGPGLFYTLAVAPWDERRHPRLTSYYRALAARPSFAKVIAGTHPHRHLFPLPWPDGFDRHHQDEGDVM